MSERGARLVRDARGIAPKLEGGVLIATLCDALEEASGRIRELEIENERLRGEVGTYEFTTERGRDWHGRE